MVVYKIYRGLSEKLGYFCMGGLVQTWTDFDQTWSTYFIAKKKFTSQIWVRYLALCKIYRDLSQNLVYFCMAAWSKHGPISINLSVLILWLKKSSQAKFESDIWSYVRAIGILERILCHLEEFLRAIFNKLVQICAASILTRDNTHYYLSKCAFGFTPSLFITKVLLQRKYGKYPKSFKKNFTFWHKKLSTRTIFPHFHKNK